MYKFCPFHPVNMLRFPLACFLSISSLLVSSSSVLAASITFTQPDGFEDIIGEGEDFALEVLKDPWDMNQASDVYIPKEVKGSMTSPIFSNGVMSFTTLTNDPYFWVLWQGYLGTQNIGKIGEVHPIDTSKYKWFSIRMYLSQNNWMYIYWYHSKDVNSWHISSPIPVSAGWHIYVVNLAQYGDWTGLIKGLRIDPVGASGIEVKIDWVRLTKEHDSAKFIPITWTGMNPAPANLDLYIDTDSNGYDGIQIASISNAPASGSFNWGQSGIYPKPSNFEPGQYYVYAKVNNSNAGYSVAPLIINRAPVAEITKPSFTSGEDYATAVLGNPWDMNDGSDITWMHDIGSYNFNGGVFNARTTGNDPILRLHTASSGIETNTYKYLTYRFYLEGSQDVGNGWVTRLLWYNNPGSPSTTEDIIISEGWNIYKLDLSQADLEPGSSPWTSGNWTWFRFDPHEVPSAMNMHLDYILLTAENREEANNTFQIKWLYNDPDSELITMTLYYDTNNNKDDGFAGTIVTVVLPPEASGCPSCPYRVYLPLVFGGNASGIKEGNYTWDTSAAASGTYYIWLKANDGYNEIYYCSELPLIVN